MHSIAASADDWPAAETGRVAAAAVVREQARPLFRFARMLGADAELADDLCQEAFVIAWQKGKQELPAAALATFLRRAVRNLWLQQRRSDRRKERAIAAAAERLWSREGGDEGGELLARTKACLARLEGRAARAIDLAYGEGASREQIATALAMKPNGVKTLLARTRQWLEQCIRRQS
jgi:RNA polymerase sigma factor (sigma-70 family)